MSTPSFLPIIEGFWIRNFKVLKQISFGSSFQQAMVTDVDSDLSPYELTALTTFIGASGVGKSTILDAFAFISDLLNLGLDEALKKRGGFDAIYSRDGEGPISFGLVYRACAEPKPLTYVVSIDRRAGSSTSAYIETEALVYRSTHLGNATQPIMLFQNGEKMTRHLYPWHGSKSIDLERIKRTDTKTLALNALSEFEDLPDVPQLKRHLDRYHLACYAPDNAFGLTPTMYKPIKGEKLIDEFKRMKEKHGFEFPNILEIIGQRLPKVERVYFDITESGRQILYFKLPGYEKPFYAHEMSEGTLRLFSHMLLFEDPVPLPLIGIEEPAAYMDEAQCQAFTKIARDYVQEMGGTQFFITTNQISLVDHMDPTEVWVIHEDAGGEIKTFRALDELAFQGVDLNSVGRYWYTDYIYRKTSF